MSMNREEGKPLTKKISSSLIEPPTLLGYQDAFARNATETGWLDISKAGSDNQWQRRWFELKDGVIRHAPSNQEIDRKESVFIPIENVIRLVTDTEKKQRRRPKGQENGKSAAQTTPQHLITMKTTHEKLILRAESSDDLNRWVFAFQRSVALAMTKIMMAQANSSMHSALGTMDDALKSSDEEALFLREAAVNDDDGWDIRRLTRARNIMHGHERVISASKVRLERKTSRSMSIDQTCLPLVSETSSLLEQQSASAAALRARAYKDRSFGDLTKIKDDTVSNSTPTSPLKLSWNHGRGDYSSTESSPRVHGLEIGTNATGSNSRCSSSCSDNNTLSQSTESINQTWRSVDDMTVLLQSEKHKYDFRGKTSPSAIGRTRSNSSGSGGVTKNLGQMPLSPGKSSYSTSSGSESLQGENIAISCTTIPTRERSSSNISMNGGRKRSDEGSVDWEGGGYIFGMDDMDSLENSLEDFSAFGDLSGHGPTIKQHGRRDFGQSPMSAYMSKVPTLRMEFGSCSKLGPKTKQEDRYVMTPSLASPLKSGHDVEGYDDTSDTYRCENSYAAVYDGHCGFQASSYVNDTLHNMIFDHPYFEYDIELAIRECSAKIDESFLERARREDIFDGTTAIGAFFHPRNTQRPDSKSTKVDFPSSSMESNCVGESVLGNQLTRQFSIAEPLPIEHKRAVVRVSDTRMTVLNIGDSGAVLCRDGVAISMSDAHSPSRPDEQRRIEEAKGWITEEKELFMGRLHRMDLSDPDIAEQAASGIQWTIIYRVLGEVSVSRSIGDYPYKGFVPGEEVTEYFSWPDNHDKKFNADLVISEPECKHVDIDELCEFVILASDGLWDVVSKEKAVSRVRAIFENGDSPNVAAEELCNLALKLGSGDNITVIVVRFFHDMKNI